MPNLQQPLTEIKLPHGWKLEVSDGKAWFYHKGALIFGTALPKSILNSDATNQQSLSKFEKFIQKQTKQFPKKLYKNQRAEYYVGRYEPGVNVKVPTHASFVDLNTVLPEGFSWVVTDTLTSDLVMYQNGVKVFEHRIFSSTFDRLAGLGIVTTDLQPKYILLTAQYMVKNLDRHISQLEEEKKKKERIKAWNS